jgi:2-keto-myo-inositol isomerase
VIVGKYLLGMNGGIEMNCGLAEEVAIIDKLGYDYIELRNWKVDIFLKDHSFDDLRALMESVKVKPLSVNGVFPVNLASLADQQRLWLHAAWNIQLAAASNCPYVVACCFGGAEGLSLEEGKRQILEGVRLTADIAAKYGITVAYEPLGNKSYPVHTIADTMELLETVDRDNVGWMLDVYHFHAVDDSLEDLAKADVDKLLIVHYDDVKDLPYESLLGLDQRAFPGEGVSDLKGILSTLYRMGYRGPFSIELFNEEMATWDPEKFASVAKQKAEEVLDKYFN